VSTLLLASRSVAVSCCVWPIATLAVAGDTVTDATGTGAGAMTVSAAVPLTPPLVAVIVDEPATRPVTSPEAETPATVVLLDAQVIARPVRTLPFASRVTAANCTVLPVWMVAVAGDTETEATGTGEGAVTVSDAEPLFPSLDAIMLAEPAPAAVTMPLELTAAMVAFELDHETARPVRTFPFASRRVAVALAVCPMTSEAGVSVTDTLATATGGAAITLRLASPRTPSLVALITAVPGTHAEIIPASDTLAIAALELSQAIGRPARGAPSASLGVATACPVCPATNDGEGSAKETAATGLRSTSTEVPLDEHAEAPRARPATARILVRIRTRPSR
jgi:hypothetical protein